MHEGRRKLWALVALCSVGAYLFAVGVPASAHAPPPADIDGFWNPRATTGNQTGAEECADANTPSHAPGSVTADAEEDFCVSDFDYGFGRDYVLKGETALGVTYVEWYDCLETNAPITPGGACQLVAFSSTPNESFPPGGVGPFLSWTASWRITENSETNNPRDLYFVACRADARPPGTGPPYDTPHCNNNSFARVHTDSAGSTGSGQPHTPASTLPTSAGHIEIIREADGTTFTGPGQVHNAGLQNGQTLDVVAYTGPSGQHDALQLCIQRLGVLSPLGNAGLANPDGAGAGCTYNFTSTSPVAGGGPACHAAASARSGSDCWAFTGINVLDLNNTFVFLIVEWQRPAGTRSTRPAGAGDCIGSEEGTPAGNDCVLDPIYVTTTVTGKPPTVGPGPPPPPPPGRVCPGRRIAGNKKDNKLRGTCGPDRMFGKAGDDRLRGKAGNDRLVGGKGFDRCFGGPGRDRFKACEIKRQGRR